MLRKPIWMLTRAASVAAILPTVAYAQATQDFDIAEQGLGDALRQVALQSGQQIVAASTLTDGKRSVAVRGRFRASDVIAVLLRGTELHAVRVGATLVIESDAGGAEDHPADDVVVTGTRIRGRGPIGSAVTTIDRKAIEESGYATVQQIAQALPQNFGGGANDSTASGTFSASAAANPIKGASLNLRGLGASSTLVLLNGDRLPLSGAGGVFADVSMIPASAVERIEVVADGASAIYGSDAVAGVVNIVPRLHFRGAETSLRYGTADGAAQEFQASQIVGKQWSSGSLVLAYEYYRRNRLAAADRNFATDDLRAFGGIDHRTTYHNPGTIYAGGQSFAIPFGQDGVGLTAAHLQAGTVNLADSWTGTDIVPEQQRHSVFAAISQDLGHRLRFYANGLLTVRTFEQRVRSSSNTRRTVPVTNAFYVDPLGTRQPVGVDYDFQQDLGSQIASGKVSAYSGSAGLEAKRGAWTIDLRGGWGRALQRYSSSNLVNPTALAAALADPDPSTAYNLFGDGAVTNPATIDKIRRSWDSVFESVSWSTTLRADGPLFAVPAGRVRVAFGGEYRFDKIRDFGTVFMQSTPVTPSSPTAYAPARRVETGYAELLVPIFGGDATLPGLHRLDVSAAVRSEHYSDFGETTNPKFGMAWEPMSGLTVRGSFGTSFRAPNFDELRQDPNSKLVYSFVLTDPASPTGRSNVVILRGNDPDLRPERATTWTLGADFKPRFLRDFHASATYFDIDYRDRIASPATQYATFLINRATYAGITETNPSAVRIAALYATTGFVNAASVPATASFAAVIDASLQNLSVVTQSGMDVELGYAFDVAGGRADIGGAATYLFSIKQRLTASAPAQEVASILGNPVDFRARGRIAWNGDHLGVALFANYVGSYVNTSNTTPERVSSWTTFDLQLSYRFGDGTGPLRGTRVALGATNLFDRNPPYAAYNAGLYVSGYDPENANPMKRVLSLQVTKSW